MLLYRRRPDSIKGLNLYMKFLASGSQSVVGVEKQGLVGMGAFFLPDAP